MPRDDGVLAWHFLPDDGKLRYRSHTRSGSARRCHCLTAKGLTCASVAFTPPNG